MIALLLAGAGMEKFRGANRLASALKETNAEFLVYFINGNEIGLINHGTIVPLNAESRWTAGACCPHHATPSLSAGSREIAYARLKSAQPRREQLDIYNLETSAQKNVFEAEVVWGISWSPQGNRLAVVADQSPNRVHNLYIVDKLSGTATQLSQDSLEIEGVRYTVSDHAPPSWNHEGTQLAVELRSEQSKKSEARVIVLWDLVARNFRKIANGINPAWSPTQDLIAFYDSDSRICFTIKSDGSDRKLLFSVEPKAAPLFFSPVWSPDGTKILFHQWVDADVITDLYQFDLQKRKAKHLARSELQVVNWRSGE
jgi:Tol biopolymer transport system component